MTDFYGKADGKPIIGTADADRIYVGGYDLTVKAGEGDDYIEGAYANPYGSHQLLYGEGGNDFIVITPADGHRADPWSLADGGSGTDTAYVDFGYFGSPLTYVHNDVSADIHCGRLAGRLVSIEKIIFQGGRAGDNLTGGNSDDAIYGNGGNDKIDGSGGNDVLSGGIGTDTVSGGTGDDQIQFDTEGNDTLDGGAGRDTLDFYTAWNGAGVTVDLTRTGVQTIDGRSITITGFENVIGTDYADKVTLTDAGGLIQSLGGNDILIGGKGADTLLGGAGNDVYFVDNVQDKVIETQSLTDPADAGGQDVVRSSVSFSLGADSGARFVENLVLLGSANLAGGGNDLANRITGNAGNNILSGQGGADVLLGMAGADDLRGGGGNDKLFGGAGRDVMTGGPGADHFVFDEADFTSSSAAGSERVTDFSHVDHDRIDLRPIDAIAGGSDNAFAFIGDQAFSHKAGELRAYASGGDTIVQGDTNGDGLADFWIVLSNAPALVKGDFLL